MVSKLLLSAAALLVGAQAAEDLLYPQLPPIDQTEVTLTVICNGGDSGACKGVTPGERVAVSACEIPTDTLAADETINKSCLTEIGAMYPDEDMSDVLEIVVKVPENPPLGVDVNDPNLVVEGLTKLQLRLCFTPTYSTDKRAWRTTDAKDDKNRVKRDKSCANIVEVDDEKTIPAEPGKEYTFTWKVPQATPIALMYPQVRYICGGDFSNYKPDTGFCGYYPERPAATISSFRTRPIEVSQLARVRGPLIALMFVAPLFLAGYFLKEFIFRSSE